MDGTWAFILLALLAGAAIALMHRIDPHWMLRQGLHAFHWPGVRAGWWPPWAPAAFHTAEAAALAVGAALLSLA